MTENLELRFIPEKKDYIAASRILAWRTSLFLVFGLMIVVVMVAALVLLLIPGLANPAWKNASIVALLVGAFYIIYFLVFIPLQLSRAFQSNAYLQKERRFIFSDDSITMVVGDKRSDLLWENVQKVIDGRDHYLLLYIAKERVYPFIPKRAFSESDAEQAFRACVEEKSVPIQ